MYVGRDNLDLRLEVSIFDNFGVGGKFGKRDG